VKYTASVNTQKQLSLVFFRHGINNETQVNDKKVRVSSRGSVPGDLRACVCVGETLIPDRSPSFLSKPLHTSHYYLTRAAKDTTRLTTTQPRTHVILLPHLEPAIHHHRHHYSLPSFARRTSCNTNNRHARRSGLSCSCSPGDLALYRFASWSVESQSLVR
jgi:hypothetical protein